MSITTLPPDVRRDVEFAIFAARTAGERVLGLRATGRWKDESMLADIGDQAADGYIQGLVRGRYPGDGILSEETADSSERLSRSRVWIIDPLDGTREYSQQREDWAVHVALTIDGRCAIAALALPARGKLLWGVCTEGMRVAGLESTGDAQRDRASGATSEGPSASASDRSSAAADHSASSTAHRAAGRAVRGDGKLPSLTRIAVSRSHTPSWMPRFAATLDAMQVHSGSVGNKVAMLLLGEADVYAHRKGLKEWDTCAPETVARALGWCVSRLNGEDLRYNQPDPHVDEFLVCRVAHREAVLGALRTAGVVTI